MISSGAISRRSPVPVRSTFATTQPASHRRPGLILFSRPTRSSPACIFFASDTPADVARKALRVNLSDLAAKGAKPAGFLLTLALPASADDDYVALFAQALGRDADAFGCPLLGGDTVSTPGPLTISITAIGHVPVGSMVPRGGAGADDRIYVTGTIGDGALGLLVCQNDERLRSLSLRQRTFLADRYRNPQPRCGIAPVLRRYASAAMDVSDGLAGDLAKMLRLAGLSARIAWNAIPLSGAAREAVTQELDLREAVLTGGDDYEVLCTVPAAAVADFEQAAGTVGVKVSCLGVTVPWGTPMSGFIKENGQAFRLDRLAFLTPEGEWLTRRLRRSDACGDRPAPCGH